MIKVLMVCHGNICRSAMAEFIMRDMLIHRGVSDLVRVASAATSREEIGNDMYPPAKRKLDREKIPYYPRQARQITRADYDEYDFIVCMEQYNIRNLKRIIPEDPEEKVHLLLDYSSRPRDISDPWYTGDFDQAYDDIVEGCEGLLDYICEWVM